MNFVKSLIISEIEVYEGLEQGFHFIIKMKKKQDTIQKPLFTSSFKCMKCVNLFCY